MLNVSIEESGKNVILRCVGQIARGYETALLCAAISQPGRNIVVDLSQVDAIDGAGVGAFIALQAAGIYLQMLNPAKAMREVLQLRKLDSILEIFTSPPSSEKASGVLFSSALAV